MSPFLFPGLRLPYLGARSHKIQTEIKPIWVHLFTLRYIPYKSHTRTWAQSWEKWVYFGSNFISVILTYFLIIQSNFLILIDLICFCKNVAWSSSPKWKDNVNRRQHQACASFLHSHVKALKSKMIFLILKTSQ